MGKYDLMIMGGGPAGYTAADRATKAGLSVILFEKDKLGGVCLNEGCIPTKTFLQSAKVASSVSSAKTFGITASLDDANGFNHETVLSRKKRVVRRLGLGVAAVVKNTGATVVNAEAVIRGKENDAIVAVADGKEYSAKNLLIATGSQAVLPPIHGLNKSFEDGYLLTSKEILEVNQVPPRLTVVGGGAVGLEFANYFAVAGSAVTVVEMLPTIAVGTEPQVSQVLQKALARKGVTFQTGARVTEIKGGTVVCEKDGETFSVDADKILFAVGRKPNINGLGLENIGINTKNGAVVTNSQLRTNVNGVYAVGDVNGKSMLAHTAYRESEVAVNDILGIGDKVSYHAIPSVIYTAPEVAWVGETEDSAVRKGLDVKTVVLPLTYSGRFVAENKDLDGMIKLVACGDKLVGAHIIGSYASEIISQAATFIDLSVPISKIKRLTFPHPTVAEIIKEAILAL